MRPNPQEKESKKNRAKVALHSKERVATVTKALDPTVPMETLKETSAI